MVKARAARMQEEVFNRATDTIAFPFPSAWQLPEGACLKPHQ
jgi:hypothetical protein